MQDLLNDLTGQLPTVAANHPNGAIAPNVPTAALPLATGVGQAEGIIQQALAVLMNTNLSPYQMTLSYIALKEDYLAKTYGVTIE